MLWEIFDAICMNGRFRESYHSYKMTFLQNKMWEEQMKLPTDLNDAVNRTYRDQSNKIGFFSVILLKINFSAKTRLDFN